VTVEKLKVELKLVEQRIAFFEQERARYERLLEIGLSKIPKESNAHQEFPRPNPNTWMKGPTAEEKSWLLSMRIKW
jgi:hypothetical protein